DAVDELGLAERLLLLRPVGAVHLAAFLKAGCNDFVAGTDIFEQILKQITVAGPVPQVMVRIDDRQIGLEDLLTPLVQPVRAHRRMTSRGYCGLWHCLAPPRLAFESRNSAPACRVIPSFWWEPTMHVVTAFRQPLDGCGLLSAEYP